MSEKPIRQWLTADEFRQYVDNYHDGYTKDYLKYVVAQRIQAKERPND